MKSWLLRPVREDMSIIQWRQDAVEYFSNPKIKQETDHIRRLFSKITSVSRIYHEFEKRPSLRAWQCLLDLSSSALKIYTIVNDLPRIQAPKIIDEVHDTCLAFAHYLE